MCCDNSKHMRSTCYTLVILVSDLCAHFILTTL